MKQCLLFLLLIITAAGYVFAQEFNIVIDAEKDEWYNTLTGPDDGFIHIPWMAGNDNGYPEDEWDLDAHFWCAWDETYFYCYEEVVDDVVNLNNTTNWANDCLELKFDPDPAAGEIDGSGVVAFRLTALDSADADESVWSGVDNNYPEGNSEIEAKTYVAGEDYARRETYDGYVVECRLPWADIYCDNVAGEERGPVFVGVGEIFGFAIMNHDNDEDGREGSIEWATVLVDAVWNDVNNHGTVTFLEDHKLQLVPENFITGEFNDFIDYTPELTKVRSGAPEAPGQYTLAQNYPNPYNPVTHIEFILQEKADVSIRVYDISGAQVATILEETRAAGRHKVTFDGSQLASGVYFYKLGAGNSIISKKMILLK